jgi:hypothetical protein
MALALASHRQGPPGRPRLQPDSFPRELALGTLGAVPGLEELRLRLLHHPGERRDQHRLALDPLADYLAALRQLELLEGEAAHRPKGCPWEALLEELESRPEEDLVPMRGFLLAPQGRLPGADGAPQGCPDSAGDG